LNDCTKAMAAPAESRAEKINLNDATKGPSSHIKAQRKCVYYTKRQAERHIRIIQKQENVSHLNVFR